MNYFLDDRINKAEILFPGVGCFLIAVFLGSAVHKSNDADNSVKLKNLESKLEEEARYVVYTTLFGYDMELNSCEIIGRSVLFGK